MSPLCQQRCRRRWEIHFKGENVPVFCSLLTKVVVLPLTIPLANEMRSQVNITRSPLHDSSLEATEVWAEKTRCKKPLKYWVIFNNLIHIIGASRSISSIRLWVWLQIKCENAHVQSFKLTFWRLNDLLLLYLNFFFSPAWKTSTRTSFLTFHSYHFLTNGRNYFPENWVDGN